MNAVKVNPTYSVPPTLLRGEDNNDECNRVWAFKELIIHWLNNMFMKFKESIHIEKTRHEIGYIEWFQLYKI